MNAQSSMSKTHALESEKKKMKQKNWRIIEKGSKNYFESKNK